MRSLLSSGLGLTGTFIFIVCCQFAAAAAPSCLARLDPTLPTEMATDKLITEDFSYTNLVELPAADEATQGLFVPVEEDFTVAIPPDLLKEFDYIETKGLYSCVVVVFRDQSTKATLLSHFQSLSYGARSPRNIQEYVKLLDQHFEQSGGDIKNSEVTIVWGAYARLKHFEEVSDMISSVASLGPKSLNLDSTARENLSRSTAAVYVRLDDGAVFKDARNGESVGRNDSGIHYQSVARKLDISALENEI